MAQDISKTESIAMMIITFAGLAKSSALEALSYAKEGKFDLIEEKLEEASTNMKEASKVHFEGISADANGELAINILMVHAEDQLMSTDTLIILVKEMIDLYKK